MTWCSIGAAKCSRDRTDSRRGETPRVDGRDAPRRGTSYPDELMPFAITEFEETPNPNAIKCWLDPPISDGIRSFLDADAARGDPIAAALFDGAPITTLLFGGAWLTVNKEPDADWASVKSKVASILAAAGGNASRG